jgi:hypothetical protein
MCKATLLFKIKQKSYSELSTFLTRIVNRPRRDIHVWFLSRSSPRWPDNAPIVSCNAVCTCPWWDGWALSTMAVSSPNSSWHSWVSFSNSTFYLTFRRWHVSPKIRHVTIFVIFMPCSHPNSEFKFLVQIKEKISSSILHSPIRKNIFSAKRTID